MRRRCGHAKDNNHQETGAGMEIHLGERETRGERSNEIGAPASGIDCSTEQLLTPRHKDLEQVLGARLFRRAIQSVTHRAQNASTSYSQVRWRGGQGGRRQKNVRRPPQRHQLKILA